MELSVVISEFVHKGWRVTSQTEKAASLEKPASSRKLAIFLGIIPVFMIISGAVIPGFILLAGVLVLVVLNNASKRNGTLHISQSSDGSITVSSNIRKLNRTYEPRYTGPIKT